METLITLIIILIFVLFFYFLIARPLRKASKKNAIMLNSINIGTVVYTKDGIRGTVKNILGSLLVLSCKPEDTELEVEYTSIESVENYDEKKAKLLMREKIQNARKRMRSKNK